MSQAYIVSAAMLRMARYKDASYSGLGFPPVMRALKEAGISGAHVQAVVCGHAFGGMLTGQRIVKDAGIGGVPVINVENACSGGATAIQIAARMIANAEREIVLVIGIDKLTQFGGGTLPLVAEDVEVQAGMVMPALYAMRARRYLYERGAMPEDLARVSVKARAHGARNPYAQMRSPTTIEEVLASRMIADPLTLFQCCPTGDGAAALVMVSEAVRRRLGLPAMRIAASVLHSGTIETGFRDMLRPEITYHSAAEAYEQASIGPEALDMVELHDAFTIAELVYYEALGLAPQGEGLALIRDGSTVLGASGPTVNPSGGLLAKGHPVGASGVAQAVEAYWQLSERANGRQIDNARFALTHVTGGGIAGFDHGACAIHIFEKAA